LEFLQNNNFTEQNNYNFSKKFLLHERRSVCYALKTKKVKQSLYTPWRRLGGEEV
jgi:hypothetical protein